MVAFAIFPIAAALFRDANIPKRLIPGALALGEGYGVHDDALPKPDQTMREHAQGSGFDLDEITQEEDNKQDDPSFAVAIAPIILVIVANLLFVQFVIPRIDTSYLALPMFGETDIDTLRGVWSIIVALSLAILLLLATNWRRLGDVKRSLNHDADASVLPIFNTASLVGFGAVIAALPVFELITNAMLSLSDGNLLVSVAVSVGAVIPFIALVAIIIIATMFGSF